MIVKQHLFVLLFTFVCILSSAVFSADLVIVNSSVHALPAGKIIQDTMKLKIPANTSITIIAQNGKSKTLIGPYSGPAGIDAGDNAPKSLVASLSSLFKKPGQESASLGAMRAFSPPTPTNPWVINVAQMGNYCISERRPTQLWRARANSNQTLIINHMGKPKTKSKTEWPAKTSTLVWPQDMPQLDGSTYLIRVKGSTSARKIVLHFIPGNLNNDAQRAGWMATKGCRKQAKMLLETAF